MKLVQRTEQIHLKPCRNLSRLCHLSKNLYNEANFTARQIFFKEQKWIRYYSVYRLFKTSPNYRGLPAKTAQQTLILLDKDWKSFFKAMKQWKKNPEKFNGRPRIPSYKPRNGEHILYFTNQQARIKDGWLILPKKVGLKVKTRIRDVQPRQVRIIPLGVGYSLEIIYEKQVYQANVDPYRVAGIDLGVRNLVTIATNIGLGPIVVKGGTAKSINQYYNKQKARLQSIYNLQKTNHTPKQMKQLGWKRNCMLKDLFHKLSRAVIGWCVKNRIGTVIVGYNKNWKQKVNNGRRNNQNFVAIPFQRLVGMLEYKAEEVGIHFVRQKENHTSKCSFLDLESIEHHHSYLGRRVSRGIFRSWDGVLVNADVNAAYNIIRKAIPEAFVDGIEDVGLHPVRWQQQMIASHKAV